MTRYFVGRIYIFDEEEFHTEESLKRKLEEALDFMTSGNTGLLWEEAKIKEVELKGHEKED